MHLSTNRIFLQRAARDFKRTGAVAPSSRALAQAMTRKLASRPHDPLAILEVGAGTGSITQEIVKHISEADILDVYEIDGRFTTLLRQRLRAEKKFQRVRSCIRVFHEPIENIEKIPSYDYVISCLPFTNFAPDAVRHIFELYRAVLKPGGFCSFYEYIFVRRAVQMISGSPSERGRVSQVTQVVREYIRKYACGQEFIFRNLPPAMVYHVRFGDSLSETA
jgi:phosphatidylethanolamine/phosphatidyl-N-methylethanolamine N-methyltransferase